MKKAIKNIALLLIVTLVIMATGGFSIYHHICNCAGDASASLFLETTCDHESSAVSSSCCSVKENSSCCDTEPGEEDKTACHDEDCCQTSSQFLKINDSFQPGFEKVSFKPVLVISTLLALDISVDDYSNQSLNLIFSDLPPPDSGKQILLSLHQLKLDPSLV